MITHVDIMTLILITTICHVLWKCVVKEISEYTTRIQFFYYTVINFTSFGLHFAPNRFIQHYVDLVFDFTLVFFSLLLIYQKYVFYINRSKCEIERTTIRLAFYINFIYCTMFILMAKTDDATFNYIMETIDTNFWKIWEYYKIFDRIDNLTHWIYTKINYILRLFGCQPLQITYYSHQLKRNIVECIIMCLWCVFLHDLLERVWRNRLDHINKKKK